uniref:WGS project CAEQ00000000 data, annotated contig 740 n=1 Tax=Trypanosoma congolense (strain IL3000) TaxID=1068625 RepID=F9WI74_TRYCI|nr:unnamed protein product [Trypanosoma congolense IL3000]
MSQGSARRGSGTTASTRGATATVSTGVRTRVKQPPLFVPLRRFATTETITYLVCHITCLILIMFTTGDELFISRERWLSFGRKTQPQHQFRTAEDVYDYFRAEKSAVAKTKLLPRQLGSDLVLSLLLVFTLNGFFLSLVRTIISVVKERGSQGNAEGSPPRAEVDEKASCESNGGKTGLHKLVNCHEFIYKTAVGAALTVCIVISHGILAQPASEVRGAALIVLLSTLTVPICYGDIPGGPKKLEKFFNMYQLIIVVFFVCLAVDANVLSQP